ncbi:hypothetical protein BLNAU_3999 [Blattamonas nauphoetae]|uniref:Uncharacterized protein n=1 Tax=Blattamonas nauphoetae TaxID=2049346 RepID=A0ABQ9YAW1_9EUKA|nr:hypothetical protein BLNAU_3999 [Blattamonas nauphoetae]
MEIEAPIRAPVPIEITEFFCKIDCVLTQTNDIYDAFDEMRTICDVLMHRPESRLEGWNDVGKTEALAIAKRRMGVAQMKSGSLWKVRWFLSVSTEMLGGSCPAGCSIRSSNQQPIVRTVRFCHSAEFLQSHLRSPPFSIVAALSATSVAVLPVFRSIPAGDRL